MTSDNLECIALRTDSFIPKSSVLHFMEFFGDIADCYVYPDDREESADAGYHIKVQFQSKINHDEFLRWPYPLFIEGHAIHLLGVAEPDVPTIASSPMGSPVSSSQDHDQFRDHGVCLKVNRIPFQWEAHTLFFYLHARFPNMITATTVSRCEDVWGYRRGAVEVASTKVSDVLLCEGESVYDGIAVDFALCNFATIQPINRRIIENATVFPRMAITTAVRPELEELLQPEDIPLSPSTLDFALSY